MQILRTILWVLLVVILAIFAANNWSAVNVKIWEGLLLETKLAALVIISFLAGFLPMWIYHRSAKWQMNRRIRTLQQAAAALSQSALPPSPPAPPPAKTDATDPAEPAAGLQPSDPEAENA